MAAEAADCRALMAALDIAPAHVVGVSFSAAVALRLAATDPAAVRTLTLVEPPPAGVPVVEEFRAAIRRLLATGAERGPLVALDELMTLLAGPDWREVSERDLPGSVAAMERDAATFLAADVPALLAWELDDADAARVRCPVLLVCGNDTTPWFTAMRDRLLPLLPRADAASVAGADHLLASTHPDETARLVLEHVRRHRS
jgi:pimeloyl-ACP methyl ester carboxylesterase